MLEYAFLDKFYKENHAKEGFIEVFSELRIKLEKKRNANIKKTI